MTEKEMREAIVPWPKTEQELVEYIRGLLTQPHDYGTCVYAMSMTATAAFYYASRVLGVTGFQASCADMDILRRTRSMKGPFGIIKAEDMIYPQYDIQKDVRQWMEEWKEWAREEAARRLAEDDIRPTAHPKIRAHWEKLAAQQ